MINERMQQLINAVSNGNKRAFSQLVGVTPTVIENIVGTRKGKPGYELLEKIAFAIENINLDWLLTGRGSMLRPDSVQQIAEPTPVSASSDAVVLRLMDKLDIQEAENKHLQSELRSMEKELAVLKAHYQHPDEAAFAFTPGSPEAYTESLLPMNQPTKSSKKLSAGKI